MNEVRKSKVAPETADTVCIGLLFILQVSKKSQLTTHFARPKKILAATSMKLTYLSIKAWHDLCWYADASHSSQQPDYQAIADSRLLLQYMPEDDIKFMEKVIEVSGVGERSAISNGTQM